MASENAKTNYYISSLLRKLRSSSASSVQKALISLSRATRKPDNVVKLREEGGIDQLLTVLKSSNKKALDMAVSALANCALEKQSRKEIKRLNGLPLLCNLLASLADISILSRVARALANLSLDVRTVAEITDHNTIPKLLEILKDSSDEPLLQNSLRALRIMSRSYACTNALALDNRLLTFVQLLHKENSDEIKRACLRTLLELTKATNGILASHFQENGIVQVACQFSYSDDEEIKENCINILCTLTEYATVRVSVGTMGGIEAFLHQIRARGPLLFSSIKGVCRCCREAVNRHKIRSCGGLELLLDILRCPEYSKAFDNILGGFSCFTYDDVALRYMIANGLIPTLVSILHKQIFSENKDIARKQDEDEVRTSEPTKTISTLPKKATCKSLKPVATATNLSSSTTSNSSRLGTPPSPLLFEVRYPTSPSSCISPNVSPELRVPHISSYSPESERSLSPMVYSPSGSEVDDSFSSESDSNPEQETEDDKSAPSQDHAAIKPGASKTPTSAIKPGESKTPTSADTTEEEASRNSHLASSNENVLSTLMEELATTHSGGMAEVWQPLQDEEKLFLRLAYGRRARQHLLPGAAGFNEHSHLFLRNENLFSADQPSRKVPPHGTNRYPWERRSRSRELPTTSKKPNPPPRTSYTNGLETIEGKVVFLLSRFGQLPEVTDSEPLMSPPCIQILLDYLCYYKNPDARCERLFSRLVWNRKCFEKLIVIMFPGALYRQLICGFRPAYLLSHQSAHSSSGAESVKKGIESTDQSPETSSEEGKALASTDITITDKSSSRNEAKEEASSKRHLASSNENVLNTSMEEVLPLSCRSSSTFSKGDTSCNPNSDSCTTATLHQPTLASKADSTLTSKSLSTQASTSHTMRVPASNSRQGSTLATTQALTLESTQASASNNIQASTLQTIQTSTSGTVQTSTSDTMQASTSDTMQASTSDTMQTLKTDSTQALASQSMQASTSDTMQASTSSSTQAWLSNSTQASKTDTTPASTSDITPVSISSATQPSELDNPRVLTSDDGTKALTFDSTQASTPDSVQMFDTAGRVANVTTVNNPVGPKSSSPLPPTSEQQEPSLISDAGEDSTIIGVENMPRNITKYIGRSLISVLTTQAGSSFGEGILEHLLLRGTRKQKEACALSLPYVCSQERLKRKLLIDCKGIMLIFSMLCDSTEQVDIARAVHSITYLVANSALKMDNNFSVFVAKDEREFLFPQKNKTLGKDSSTTEDKDRNFVRMLSKDRRLRTEYFAKAKNYESRQRFDHWMQDNEERLSEVDPETGRLPRAEEYARLNFERYRRFRSMIGHGVCDYNTAPKRLRRVADLITCKRTRVESDSAEPETCPGGNCCYGKSHSTPFDVVVKLDTGESIEAHRSILCALSEVFAAMLSSDFIEANQSEVMIKELNHATAIFLVHYAYGCRWSVHERFVACPLLEESLSSGDNSAPSTNSLLSYNSPPRRDRSPPRRDRSPPRRDRSQSRSNSPSSDNPPTKDRFKFDLDFLMDLLACADRFLLTALKKQCEHLMMYGLKSDQVVNAYLAAVFYNTARLRVYALQFIFLGNLDMNCVYDCVVKLLQSEVRETVIEDFKNIAMDCCA